MCCWPGLTNTGSHVLHLRTRAQFQAVTAASTVAKTAHFVMHRCALVHPDTPPVLPTLFPETDVWVGAVLPKRWAKRAVTRHLIKRQVYAIAAQHPLPVSAYVVRLRQGFDAQRFTSACSEPLKQAVRTEIQQLFSLASGHPPA